MTFYLKAERIAPFRGKGFDRLQEGHCRMRKTSLTSMDDAQASFDGEFRHLHTHKAATRQLRSDTEPRHQGYASTHLDKALNGLE